MTREQANAVATAFAEEAYWLAQTQPANGYREIAYHLAAWRRMTDACRAEGLSPEKAAARLAEAR